MKSCFNRHKSPQSFPISSGGELLLFAASIVKSVGLCADAEACYDIRLEAFPTINKLSESSIEEVNSLWKGLGYYSRASRLLAGSKTVVKRYKGKLPSHPDELVKEIEGIGPYTAGAIASIAYGVRTPTVDGNVSMHEILSREP